MDTTLLDIARSAAHPGSLEELARNLLVVLERLSGIESVYLTRYDAEARTYEVLFSRNTHRGNIDMPEGLSVPLDGTLCQRAVAAGVRFSQAPAERWPDAAAVRDMNIRTYVVEPVRHADGRVLGTLCAVSDRRVAVDEQLLLVMGLSARLLERQVAHDRLERVEAAPVAAATAPAAATVDPLTGLANRRGLAARLAADLVEASRFGGRVAVAFVDLDDGDIERAARAVAAGDFTDADAFAPPDALVLAVAARLAAALGPDEFVARYDAQTLVVAGRLPERASEAAPMVFQRRVAALAGGRFVLGETVLDYRGATVGTAVSRVGDTAQTLLQRADEAMFELKQQAFAATVIPRTG